MEETEVGLVTVNLALRRLLVEVDRAQCDLQTAGEGCQRLVELLSTVFGFKEAFKRFGVLLVRNFLEDIPKRCMIQGQLLDLFGGVCNDACHSVSIEGGQSVIGIERCIQLAENP